MAYHLQKMQESGNKKEDMRKIQMITENKVDNIMNVRILISNVAM